MIKDGSRKMREVIKKASDELLEHIRDSYAARKGWDADRVRDQLRGYVCEHLAEQNGVLVVVRRFFSSRVNTRLE